MDYISLTAAKGTAGSILNWVGYSKMDAPTLLLWAEGLIFQMLRTREMRSEWVFGAAIGQASVDLPSGFLDPIGKIRDVTNNVSYDQLIQPVIEGRRMYEQVASVALGNNPFTTVADSGLVTVNDTAHGINQDSAVTISGAAAVNGITMNGTFPVDSVTDADNFVIDTGGTASASSSGGGSSAAYTAANLIAGSPMAWAIWDEAVKFDFAFDTAAVMKLPYFKRPLPLGPTNTTNFLTIKYPNLILVGTMAAAAKFMKDDGEYQKLAAELQNMIQSTAIVDDFGYRGATFGTETP